MPTLLGAAWDKGNAEVHVEQYILEPLFGCFERYEADKYGHVFRRSFVEAIDTLIGWAKAEKRLLVGWSNHERNVVEIHTPSLSSGFDSVYRNAIPFIKRWARATGRTLPTRTSKKKGWTRPGRHWLDLYLNMVGYPLPKNLGPGNTGKRLTYVRGMLERREGQCIDLTPTAKGKWQRLRGHNYHDLAGLLRLLETAANELE